MADEADGLVSNRIINSDIKPTMTVKPPNAIAMNDAIAMTRPAEDAQPIIKLPINSAVAMAPKANAHALVK